VYCTKSCIYSQKVLLMMGELVARNMLGWFKKINKRKRCCMLFTSLYYWCMVTQTSSSYDLSLCATKYILPFLHVVIWLYFSVMNCFLMSQRISWMTYNFAETIVQIIKCGYYHHRILFDAAVYNPAMKRLTIMYVLCHINTIKVNLIMHTGRSVLFMSAHYVINRLFERP
jgi:hypothetical protein